MNIENAINEASRILKKNNIKSSKLDCEILMSKVIEKDRKFIILNPLMKLKKNSFNHFKNLIDQRSMGKPIAYLTGKKDFWKHEFQITEDTLIPRPDTELIIEQVIKITKNKSKLKILDVGVGSGCILLSVLKEKKDFYGVGIDVSKKCIDISKINALRLEVTNRVKFFKSDVDNFLYGKYDLIISNPPYIKKLDLKYLDRDVINFEPKLALDGGLEGISEISKVIHKSSELIKKNGKLVLEIAFDQKEKVKKLLNDKGFYINNILKDYAKNDRCIISTKL
ncbi:MAG: peptide chain release factor N(5)-glutamine methyltransferase [Polaribacter sp.]|jgi:release factor glutamine methyltransferase|nr:peptide chain release factor N(5)-glutamine methyltransferase [Polaribacter sp.]